MEMTSSAIKTAKRIFEVLEYFEDGKAEERMIPFVSAYVDSVDLTGKRIVVDWQTDY